MTNTELPLGNISLSMYSPKYSDRRKIHKVDSGALEPGYE
jgi:hypothetical protein